MDLDKYVVISFNEDGDPPHIEQLTGPELKDKLKEHWWGSRPNFAEPGQPINTEGFSGVVVIRGEIIKPKAVQVATEYDL